MAYQKVYMNQIHSSSLLCQLAQMWREEILCDAHIRTGNTSTKAHRVVLVAACPMLQSMDGSSLGSTLEVKLSPDIHQDSVTTFLQYLYEGFMTLTEENVKDIEKIAALLQVDSVTKCCSDFQKALLQTTGKLIGAAPKCSFHADQAEFRHVRSSELLRSMENGAMKRGYDSDGVAHGFNKRARAVAEDIYNSCAQRNHIGRQNLVPTKQVIEDSFEVIQAEKDPLKPKIHQNLGIKVASHIDAVSDIHVIEIPDVDTDQNSYTSPRQSPFSVLNPHRLLSHPISSTRKHSPKTISQSVTPIIRNQPARSKPEIQSLFTTNNPGQSKFGDVPLDSKKAAEQSDQIVIQPISDGDNSPVNSSIKGDDSNDKTAGASNSDQDPGELSIVKVEKVNHPVSMDTDSRGETDKQGETSLQDDDGEDDYSEGEIYRFADTSGMPGSEDEPGNSWYIETLKGQQNMPPLQRKHKRKPDKSNVRSMYLDPTTVQTAMFDACSINNNYPSMQLTGNEPEERKLISMDDFTEEDNTKIRDILNQSNSRQNFAWKLCQFFFSVSELEGCNCYGRKGKKPLDFNRLNKIQSIAFFYFPLTVVEDYTKAWSNCRIAIDKGIRNIFYPHVPSRKAQESSSSSLNTPMNFQIGKFGAVSMVKDA